MSGKKRTVIYLGKALGRQVVCMHCCPNMTTNVVWRMLAGALKTGAWLVLDSVDLLSRGVLSSLGQHLVDIQQSFTGLTGNKRQKQNNESKGRSTDQTTGCKHFADSEFHVVFGGKSISASLSYGCVVIPSKGFISGLPESLLNATRPVALTHPDHRIIAEVVLTSFGFSDAVSLSKHLVSLLRMAKDSRCLPDFVANNQSCCLVILQKIISASEIYLRQSIRQREISDEAEVAANLASLQNVITSVIEKDHKETEKSLRWQSSHSSVIRVITEETAVVKAILSVLLPLLHEQKKASHFSVIFQEMFPIASQFPLFQQHIEEEEKKQLKDALSVELRKKLFHSDPEIIRSALTLYWTMKSSRAVMLIGPPGSGKTTCLSALAGALNHLAAKRVESFDSLIKGGISASTWTAIRTVVFFPNTLTHEEIFGCFCENKGFQDGVVAKVLRDLKQPELASFTSSDKRGNQIPIMTWLVMDGNPLGQPGWLDYLTTLCNPHDPFLCLPSGENLPSQSLFRLLMEITDLCDASPSAVTYCSLVYFTGTDQWKAVWKSEMNALSFEHELGQETLKMWKRLSEDLFSSTLSLLSQKALTSAVHNERESSTKLVYGLQEIMSFVRILRALLQHFGQGVTQSDVVSKGRRGIIIIHKYLTL